MIRQLTGGLLTLILMSPVIANTETDSGEWWTNSFQSETDGVKTCEAGTRLALGEPGSNTPAAVLIVSYSSTLESTPKLVLIFLGDRLVSDIIRVRFDTEPAFTTPIVKDEAMVVFAPDSPVLQGVRNARTMKLSLKLMYQGRTSFTFSLRGSAKAINSAKAACSQGEATDLINVRLTCTRVDLAARPRQGCAQKSLPASG